jgi:mannose-6-phosphate isomerase-like protein (cupin superfamily)
MKSNKPYAGQKWNLPEIVKGSKSFLTMIGDYETDGPTPFLKEMSLHFYRLDEGAIDTQRPHEQDELYYVLSGKRVLNIVDEGKEVNVELGEGDLIYVPANAAHKFTGTSEISLLVFFAPNYSGPKETS